jgi:hypothetical protein
MSASVALVAAKERRRQRPVDLDRQVAGAGVAEGEGLVGAVGPIETPFVDLRAGRAAGAAVEDEVGTSVEVYGADAGAFGRGGDADDAVGLADEVGLVSADGRDAC